MGGSDVPQSIVVRFWAHALSSKYTLRSIPEQLSDKLRWYELCNQLKSLMLINFRVLQLDEAAKGMTMDYSVIRNELRVKLEELKARAREIEDKLSRPGQADWEENATESEGDEVQFTIGELTKREIREIEQALQLIDEGKYGKCLTCGKPIELARLEALPFTATCKACA